MGEPCTQAYADTSGPPTSRLTAPDPASHLKHLKEVFKRLSKARLKLKKSKCEFYKEHIQYLGHLISGKGIEPVPAKLVSISEMPAPTTPTEIKQFLGLVGYYRKFVARFSDIARPLTALTRHDVDFIWTEQCQSAFEFLKDQLIQAPILKYPDPEKPYVLYTDASKYAWSAVLTQAYKYVEETVRKREVHHPITYVSGLSRGAQLNWATLTKEAFAIYMSVRKLTFFITDADITIYTDHLPLKRFLERKTQNEKVNNWALELEQFRIKVYHIKGIKNTLADTLSRLIDKNIASAAIPEPNGEEFGYALFDPVVINQLPVVEDSDTYKPPQYLSVKDIIKWQMTDPFCVEIKIKLNNLPTAQKKEYMYYLDDQGLLHILF
jgi:hypothetical protein